MKTDDMNLQADVYYGARRTDGWLVFCLATALLVVGTLPVAASAVEPTVVLRGADSVDQDDMCFWLNKKDPSKSTVITSDKSGDSLFVYDLQGDLLQKVSMPKPGNIDIRSDFPLGENRVDIVAVNQREDGYQLRVFQVDPTTRLLTRIDGGIPTGPNYGGCLYHSRKSDRFYFICTSDSGTLEQYELTASTDGKTVTGTKVRHWKLGKCEGAVADDEHGVVYIGEENKGVWKLNAEPDGATPGQLVIEIGQNKLQGDIEGLTLYRSEGGGGYLIVSDQGRNTFMVYERGDSNRYVGQFTIDGVQETDGIDVLSIGLGDHFPDGVFACHNGAEPEPHPVVLTPWPNIKAQLKSR